jgi:hypothetical protein
MNTPTVETAATEPKKNGLTTADLAAVSQKTQPAAGSEPRSAVGSDDEQLAPLFSADVAKDFRSRWDAVQGGFVDDPRQAVRQGDELVAEVMKTLAETFSKERTKLEGQLDNEEAASTENLRVTLRHYRSFFKRLLSL